MTNPWLTISPADYEGHMASPEVDQLSFLAHTFKESLRKYNCDTVALLGCATGNGLEHINSRSTRRITAVDINPEYLGLLRARYAEDVYGLEVIQGDLKKCDLESKAYSLIFAGLLFEYLEPPALLRKIRNWLQRDGTLLVVLQLPSKGARITETPYTSIKSLRSLMTLIPPQDFKEMAADSGLQESEARTVTLETGKSFYIATYARG